MGLSFEQKLRNYARLGLIHGLGLGQKARPLYIDPYQTEDHGHFITVLAEEAYDLGVETVDVRSRDIELERVMFQKAPEEYKLYVPKWVNARAQEIVNRDGARIALNGNGGLGVMDDVDPKYPSGFQSAYFEANEPYTTRRMKMLQPWTILDVPTHAWSAKLGTSIEDLWEFLFTITGADRDDPIEYANEVNAQLHRRCELLNSMKISTLSFHGRGTHLIVGLSPRARWLGGRKQAEDGTWFEPNWPSFEVFTTPDWRTVDGFVRVTMPSVVSGPIVDGLTINFEHGRVVLFEAEKGREVFESLITRDDGAAQLGEIACVGLDSPLSRYTEPHYCGMLDENKRCHMAFGKSYAACIEGGQTATDEELRDLGCNTSEIHHDMMISDETTLLVGYRDHSIQPIPLIEDGYWVGEFA